MKRITEMSAAFDKRHKDPKKNYGIHGVEVRFVLKGRKGATLFVIYTDWMLPHVQKEFHGKDPYNRDEWHDTIHLKPMGADIGYHSRKPIHDFQKEGGPSQERCGYLNAPCYYDGSSLQATERGVPTLLNGGSDAVWEMLEEEYERYFGAPISLKLRRWKKKHQATIDKWRCRILGHKPQTCIDCERARVKRLKKEKAKQTRLLKKASEALRKEVKRMGVRK